MSSYALLDSLSGFRYSAVDKTHWLGPRIAASPFTSFFSAAYGFGSISADGDKLSVALAEGGLSIDWLEFMSNDVEKRLKWGAIVDQGATETIKM